MRDLIGKGGGRVDVGSAPGVKIRNLVVKRFK